MGKLLSLLKPNQQQIKSAIRWALTAFSAPLTLWLVQRGLSADQAASLLSNDALQMALASGAFSVISFLWSMVDHTEKNTAIAAETMPNVQAVVTKPTPAGEALAKAIPSPNVIAATDPKLPLVVLPGTAT